MLAKKEGIGRPQLEIMGKYLWRLYMVFEAYNHRKRDISFSQIIDIVDEFKSVFVGA